MIWLLTPDSIEKRARAAAAAPSVKDTAKADFIQSLFGRRDSVTEQSTEHRKLRKTDETDWLPLDLLTHPGFLF